MPSPWKEIDPCTLVMRVPGGLLYRVSTYDGETDSGSEALAFVPVPAVDSRYAENYLKELADAYP